MSHQDEGKAVGPQRGPSELREGRRDSERTVEMSRRVSRLVEGCRDVCELRLEVRVEADELLLSCLWRGEAKAGSRESRLYELKLYKSSLELTRYERVREL